MRATSETSHQALQEAVLAQLEWDPAVDARAVTVEAVDGHVTLHGAVDSYPAKLAAEKAVRRVHGVRGVTNAIEVRLAFDRTDEDLAENAALALRLHSTVPETVHADVRDGRVMLAGPVDWPFQKRSAERAVREIRGLRDVVNRIVVAPRGAAHDVRHRIIRTLQHNAEVDARHIKVTVAHDCATLTGTVGSWLDAKRPSARPPMPRALLGSTTALLVVPPPWSESDVDELC